MEEQNKKRGKGRPRKEKDKGGRPKKFTADKLLELFINYIEEEGFKEKYQTYNGGLHGDGEIRTKAYVPISINGFCVCLLKKKRESLKEKIKIESIDRSTFYDYLKEFPDTKKEIDDLIENHIVTGIALGDIAQSFGIFYLKNKQGYIDKIETFNTNIEKKIELTDEELKEIAGIK